jgi:hypothetical protein
MADEIHNRDCEVFPIGPPARLGPDLADYRRAVALVDQIDRRYRGDPLMAPGAAALPPRRYAIAIVHRALVEAKRRGP